MKISLAREYYQCECRNKDHIAVSKERWEDIIEDDNILKDTATMLVTVNDDYTRASCVCPWCEYKENVDLEKNTLTLIQHGKATVLGQTV